MAGRRRELRIIKRSRHDLFRRPTTLAVVFISFALLPLAICLGMFHYHERISFVTEAVKTQLFKCLRTGEYADQILHTRLKKLETEVSNLPRVWTNLHIHLVYLAPLPFVFLILTGWKNLKEMAEIIVCMFRLGNITALFLIWYLMVLACLVAYIVVPMFYEQCIALAHYVFSLSVVEVNRNYKDVFDSCDKPHPQDVAPYFTIDLKRYNMEDVIMACRFFVTREREVPTILKSFRWIKDDVHQLCKTERMHINTTVYRSRLNTKTEFLIESKLTITLLDDADYGNYSCRYSRTKEGLIFPEDGSQLFELEIPSLMAKNALSLYEPKQDVAQVKHVDLYEETFSNFHLQKWLMTRLGFAIPPGGLFIEHVPYWSLADPGGIIINETVWDNDNDDCCSWFSRLYKFLFGYRDLVWRDKFGLGRQRYLIRQKCVCYEDFALKNNTFSITRYNSTSKRQQVFPVHYPQQLIMVPYISNEFTFTTDKYIQSSFFDDFVACATGSDTSPVCERRLKSMKDMSTDATQLNLCIRFFCFIILFIITCVLSLYLKWIWKHWVIPFIRFLGGTLLEGQRPPWYDHDLYMTYDETDEYELEVARRLKHTLEIIGCRVFDACKDILPGFPELHEREKAIRSSKHFCLIISQASQNEGQTILEHTAIKQTLADRKTAGTETEDCKFVIQIGDCDSDGFLIPGNVVVSQSERKNYELDESVELQFLRWATGSIIDNSSCFNLSVCVFSIGRLVIIALIIYVAPYWMCIYRFWPTDDYKHHVSFNVMRKLYYEPE